MVSIFTSAFWIYNIPSSTSIEFCPSKLNNFPCSELTVQSLFSTRIDWLGPIPMSLHTAKSQDFVRFLGIFMIIIWQRLKNGDIFFSDDAPNHVKNLGINQYAATSTSMHLGRFWYAPPQYLKFILGRLELKSLIPCLQSHSSSTWNLYHVTPASLHWAILSSILVFTVVLTFFWVFEGDNTICVVPTANLDKVAVLKIWKAPSKRFSVPVQLPSVVAVTVAVLYPPQVIPYGLHMESMSIPYGLHIHSIWTSCPFHMDSMD